MSKIKRLYIDCETSPNIGFFWNPGHKVNISYENIIKERAIICICYSWEGDAKVHALTWNKGCDKKMLIDFMKVAGEADEIVGHNGDRYDIPWIRTRCIFHRIPVPSGYATIDTLKFARSKCRFNSNRLDYIAKFLGFKGKIHTGFDLWKNICLRNCQESLDKMVRYCKGDVKELKKVLQVFINHIPAKVHHGVVNGGEKEDCPECGSVRMSKVRVKVSATGQKRRQLQCKDCGKHHTIAFKE
jgi:hypothetical protein